MLDTEKALRVQLQTLTEERDAWAAKYHQSADAYAQLWDQLRQLLRHRFGRKSERFEDASDPQQWLFDLPAQAADDDERSHDDNIVSIAAHRRQRKRAMKFPESLPRQEVVVAVDASERQCGCGEDKVTINHALHERLHYQPPVFEVLVEKREIVACPKGCSGEVFTAPRPKHILPKSKMTEALLAHLIVSKLDDRQPFYHLEQQLKHRAGGGLSRQTMARAAIACHRPLQPLVNLFKDEIIGYDVGALDATGLQVLKESGRAASVTSSAYCFRGGPASRSAIVYAYNAQAHKQFVDEWFAGFSGVLHCDADPLFERLFARPQIQPSYCNAHARRKFEPVARASAGDGLARTAMQFYKRLYRIERQATAQQLTPERRWALRQAHARPIMAEFKCWLDTHYPSVLPKSTLGKAFSYALARWDGFCAYLDDGRVEIDNNLTEQQIKPFVIARKNFLFADSVAGAQALCVHFSLIRTAKLHGLDPYRYYQAILTAVPHCQCVGDYERLLPWNITLDPANRPARAA